MFSKMVALLSVLVLCQSVQSATPLPVIPPEIVTGQVFLEGTPMSDIRVTDGVGFALTDSNGMYSLPILPDATTKDRPSRVVSVSWPSGTWPDGMWWQRLSGVPVGGSINFALKKQHQNPKYTFLHASDDHSRGTMYPIWAVDVNSMMPQPAFVVNTGDLGNASSSNAEAMFSSIAANSSSLSVPIFHIPGNHDKVYSSYTKYLGPVRWSFDYAGDRFVGIDAVPSATGAGLAWLKKDLASVMPGQRVFFFIHSGTVKDARITHTFSGHSHSAKQSLGISVAPSLSGASQGSSCDLSIKQPSWLSGGGCVMGVVTANKFYVADRCAGCKVLVPTYHDSGCPVGKLAKLISSLKSHRSPPVILLNSVIREGDLITVAGFNSPYVSNSISPYIFSEIDADMGVPAGGSVWIEIGQANPLKISYNGVSLTVAGSVIPLRLREGETTVKIHMYVTKTTLTLYANSLFTITWPVVVDNPSQVTVGANGGPGFFKSFTAWGIR